MPSVSPSQQRLFGMALSMKKNKKYEKGDSPATKIAKTLPIEKIREFARTKS